MTVQKLYYGRHGETKDLVDGVRSRFDTPLTARGRDQMKKAGRLLLSLGIQPSLIVCSELPRAIHSAQIVADEIGYDKRHIQCQALFNERDCGEAEGMLHADIARLWPDGYDTVPGAENLEQMQQRAARAATWLSERAAEEVLVIAHGTFGRAMLRAFEGRPHTDEHAPGRVSFGRAQIMRLYPQPTSMLTL